MTESLRDINESETVISARIKTQAFKDNKGTSLMRNALFSLYIKKYVCRLVQIDR